MDSNSGIIYTFTNNNNHHQQQQQQQQSINNDSNNNNFSNTANLDSSNNNTSAINPFVLIEHLQQKIKQEQNLRLELEKELSSSKAQIIDLQNELQGYKNSLQKNQELQKAQLETIKKRLTNTISKSLEDSINNNDSDLTSNDNNNNDSNNSLFRKFDYLHECDECVYKTKSNVSLILHKMNHKITEIQYLLSSQSFTTRDSNSKAIYKCAACNLENLTRHQVYRHIYENHTFEKPLSCPYCELSFTHNDYLKHHIDAKHYDDKDNRKNLNYINLDTPSSLEKLKTRKSNSGHKRSSSLINKKISNKDLKCTFPDCNFVTIFPEKLNFHMEAHINTKFKCPYCPYVSNTIVDIKRHILKSKKHVGLKVYSCQKCGFAADCDRTFKEHLKGYHFGHDFSDTAIDYFIEEMFSNKNKRNQDEDNVIINLEIDKAIASISESNATTNNLQSSNKLTTTIVPITQPVAMKRSQANDDNQQTILLSSLPKKMSISKRLLNFNDQHQSSSSPDLSIEQTSTMIENQPLDLHSTSNQNTYQNLQMAAISDSDTISFLTQQQQQQQQQPNITSLSNSSMTITDHNSSSTQHHHQNHHHHHTHHNNQQHQQQHSTHLSQNTISLLSMPENFVQSLVVQQPQQITSNQQNTSNNPNNNNNVIGNVIDPNNLNNIPVTLAAQYISYVNY